VNRDREGLASSHKLGYPPYSRGTPLIRRFEMVILGTYPKTRQNDDRFLLVSRIRLIFLVFIAFLTTVAALVLFDIAVAHQVTELQVFPGLPSVCKSLQVAD
jgi:hypothetical protein